VQFRDSILIPDEATGAYKANETVRSSNTWVYLNQHAYQNKNKLWCMHERISKYAAAWVVHAAVKCHAMIIVHSFQFQSRSQRAPVEYELLTSSPWLWSNTSLMVLHAIYIRHLYQLFFSGWVFDSDHPAIKKVSARVSAITGLSLKSADAFQVTVRAIRGL